MEYCLQLGGEGGKTEKKKEKKREVKSLVLHSQNTFSVALGKLLLYTSVYQPKNCLKKTPLLITFMMCFGVWMENIMECETTIWNNKRKYYHSPQLFIERLPAWVNCNQRNSKS